MKQKGFTLFEVAISCVLLSLLLAGAFSFFSTMYVNYLQLEERSRMQEEARIVEKFITQEIEEAKTVTLINESSSTISKSSKSSPREWKEASIPEVKLKSIILDKGTSNERKIEVDSNTLRYYRGGTSNVLTDLLKDGSIYISKDAKSDIINIKLHLEKVRDYRPDPPKAVHSFTVYIKISLKYKDDV